MTESAYIQKIKQTYSPLVVDISGWQGDVDAAKLVEVQRITQIIHRISVGGKGDAWVTRNLPKFYNLGTVDIGAYLAPTPGWTSAQTYDAFDAVWDVVGPLVNGRVWLDIEHDGLTSIIRDLLQGMTGRKPLDELVGHEVGIYTNLNYTRYYRMWEWSLTRDRLLWVASYNDLMAPTYLTAWKPPVLWQYTTNLDGKASGVGTLELDGNVVYPRPENYACLVIRDRGVEPPPPPPPPDIVVVPYAYTNLRKEPRSVTETLYLQTRIPGVELEVLEDLGDWYKVQVSGDLYVSKSVVKPK